jgi:beta-lactam-binding protein with PASTA domain
MCKKLIVLCLALVVVGLSVPASAAYIGFNADGSVGNVLKVDIGGALVDPNKDGWQSWVFPTPWIGPILAPGLGGTFNNPLATGPWELPTAELDVYSKNVTPPITGLSRNRSGGWAGVPGTGIAQNGTGFGMHYVKLTLDHLKPDTLYTVSLWSYEARQIWNAAPANPDSKYVCWSTTNPKAWLDTHGYSGFNGEPNGYGPIIPLPDPLTGESGMPAGLAALVAAEGGRAFMMAPTNDNNDYCGGTNYVVELTAMTNSDGVIVIYGWIDPTDWVGSMHVPLNGFEVPEVFSEPPPCTVPYVVGQTQDAACTVIENANLVCGNITTACSDTIAAGNVISTTPSGWASVTCGSAVDIVVSTGPCCTVPDVVGQTQDAACTAIENANLVCGNITTACSATIAAGNVISTTPAGGAEVECGSAVDIVVSTGPCCTVPDVVGQTQDAACTAIENANLVCGNITTACSATIAAGNVISTTPAGGAEVECGSVVDIVVSTGPCPCTVPYVVGQTQDAACTVIENANLVCGNITTACSATIAAGYVISTTPTGWASVTCGSAVDIVVSTKCKHDIKWSQPPEEIHEGIINGWDETSDYNNPPLPVVADDWLCIDNRPIKGIHWWGSFKGWTGPNHVPPAQMPEAFHIGIWTDVPDPDPNNPNTFSHPGELIWEKTSHCFVWSFAGYELVPIIDTFTTVMESNTTGWDTEISAPFVIYDAGLYKMWYGASSGPWPLRQVIAYAESIDGITWSNKQVVHDSGSGYYVTGYPWVIKEGETYRMWHGDYYEGVAGDWSWYIAHMTSTDGINWPGFMSAGDQKVLSALGQSNPQGDGYCTFAPCVLYEPGIGYTMWYSVIDHYFPRDVEGHKIWRATSNDGITWSNRQLSLPYIPNTWEENVEHASVVKENDGTYTMFYGARYSNDSIGITKSADGITWTDRKQWLKPSDLNTNITYIREPFHFRDVDGKRYLYFSYHDEGDGKYKLGRIQIATPDACFKFDQLLSENEWFHQEANEPNGTIYWLSIAAIYNGNTPQYPWGWKTRPHYYKDDAVRIQTLVGSQWPPTVGSVWGSGVPIRLPEYPDPCGVSWDTTFVLTADRKYVPLKWRWTDDADRADLVEDGKIDFKDFAILAQHWLDEADPWPE